jgi:glycosyltransferase involved in cell wall biosynthesis
VTPRGAPGAAVGETRRDPMSGRRVAMVAARYPPFLGGIETHVYEVARRMAARGLNLTVLTTDPSGRLAPHEEDGALVVRRFPAHPRHSDLHVSPALARDVARGGYDLVHVQGINTVLPPMVLRAAQRAGIPTVATFHTGGHSSRVRNAIRETQWRTLGPLLRRSNALVAVCAYEVEVFARRLGVEPGAIRLIRNGAEALPLSAARAEAVALSGSPLICSVGRLERYKGHHRLIAAMPALLETAPDARLVVVGRGAYEKQLRRLVVRLGVGRAVTFTAFDSDERGALGDLVRASDVVALLSDYEANPVALMEALALGRKVVVAATSGLTELATEGLATAVAPDTAPAALAAVLHRVAHQPDPPVPDLPTWDTCVDDLLGVYAAVAPARR